MHQYYPELDINSSDHGRLASTLRLDDRPSSGKIQFLLANIESFPRRQLGLNIGGGGLYAYAECSGEIGCVATSVHVGDLSCSVCCGGCGDYGCNVSHWPDENALETLTCLVTVDDNLWDRRHDWYRGLACKCRDRHVI